MAHKGVGRSNAKISAEEIIETLGTRGDVKTFDLAFNAFTTGKTKIDDHKEILYLCKVNRGIQNDGTKGKIL
jgi:adenine-specific DNA-methyltransferase